MTSVGDQLNIPESGWKRYDDMHPTLKYNGPWSTVSNNADVHLGTAHYMVLSGPSTGSIEFHFYGSKIRLIDLHWTDRVDNVTVDIDGVVSTYNPNNSANKYQVIVFEELHLPLKLHRVKLTTTSTSNNFSLDAIDIDSDGRMLHPDEVTDPIELSVGKRIRCSYRGILPQLTGVFTGLGQESFDFLPTSSSGISFPYGDFYLIMTETQDKKKMLVSDRNIQHFVSWDTINSAGMVSGLQLEGQQVLVSALPPITANEAPYGKASASSIYSTTYDAYRAFDKTGIAWLMQNQRWNGSWVRFDFVNSKIIKAYSYTQDITPGTDSPRAWRVEGSNDGGSTWTVLDTQTNQTGWTTGLRRQYSIPEGNAGAYTSYRMVFTANGGGAYIRVREVDFLEEVTQLSDTVVRLMSGGASAEDTNNEWDRYIVHSTLNNTITAGDDHIWNWSGAASWTSTTNNVGPTYRTGRGGISGDVSAIVHNPSNYSAAAQGTGFRPILVIPYIHKTRTLIKTEGKHKAYRDGQWTTISTVLPSIVTLLNEGMSDLTVLDRKSSTFAKSMTSKSELGSGKVFNSTLDLKKYIEITNLSIQ